MAPPPMHFAADLLGAVCVIDQHGEILRMSSHACLLFGYQESDLAGRGIGVLFAEDGDGERLPGLLATVRPQTPWSGEIRCQILAVRRRDPIEPDAGQRHAAQGR